MIASPALWPTVSLMRFMSSSFDEKEKSGLAFSRCRPQLFVRALEEAFSVMKTGKLVRDQRGPQFLFEEFRSVMSSI